MPQYEAHIDWSYIEMACVSFQRAKAAAIDGHVLINET